MEQCDIVYIHGCPTVSAIYYHTQLYQTHCLYCPHSIQVPVRELGKNLLHILDSQDTKKLAVHFPAPLADTQARDILKFLRSRRSSLRIGLLVLPVTPYQKQLWLGWAASFAESTNSDASLGLWADRCLNNNQFDPESIDKELFDYFELSPPKMRLDTAILVSNQRFEKKALIVHISKQLASFTIENGLQFDPVVSRLIEAYAQCVKFPRIILIGNERAIFGKIANYSSSSQEMKHNTIKRYRQATKAGIQSLSGSAPVYICCTPYDGMQESSTMEMYNLIAWLQHRHHLLISNCLLAQWAISEHPKDLSPNLQHLLSFSLRDRSYFALNKWKTEIESLLAKANESSSTDQATYISPHRLLIKSELSECDKPLVKGATKELVNIEEQGNIVSHGICCNNHQVWVDWVKSAEVVQDTVMTETNDRPTSVESRPTSEQENVLSRTAGRLTNESIQHYIGNPNSFRKGRDLLSTLSTLAVKYEDDTAFLTGKAQGTSEAPYNLRILLGIGNLLSHGFCSCYVGKEGRCKHIVALLLKFKEGAADFDQSQSTLPLEDAASKQVSIEDAPIHSSNNMETSDEIVLTDTKAAASSDNPILLPPTPRNIKGRRKLPTQWSEPTSTSGSKKRKKVTEPHADLTAPEIAEAETPIVNDQQLSDTNYTNAASTSTEKTKMAKKKAIARKSKTSPASMLDSDSDIDDHDQQLPAPRPLEIVSARSSRNHIDENDHQSETSSANAQELVEKGTLNITAKEDDISLQNLPKSKPVTRAAKRIASFTDDDDDPMEQSSSTKKSAAGRTKHDIDMQKSQLRVSDHQQAEKAQSPVEAGQPLGGARKKKKLDKMLDDLFSL